MLKLSKAHKDHVISRIGYLSAILLPITNTTSQAGKVRHAGRSRALGVPVQNTMMQLHAELNSVFIAVTSKKRAQGLLDCAPLIGTRQRILKRVDAHLRSSEACCLGADWEIVEVFRDTQQLH